MMALNRMQRTMLVSGSLAWAGWRLLRVLRTQRLRGDVVLITGGSRGLGLLLAREFAAHGCPIVICARDEEELREARADLEGRGADVLALKCDISDRTQVDALVARAMEHFGRIDILVNNAGIVQVGPLEVMRVEDFEQVMAVNFWGAVYASYAVLPQMCARGSGRIVNITSIGGKVAVPHLLPYSCAKFAMAALSAGLAAELAQHGIRVTTIVPGLMRTGSPANAFFKGKQAREYGWFSIASATPLTAMSARRAARRIVAATRRGEIEVTLTWQATLLRALHGLMPARTTRALAMVNRLLPGAASEQTATARGMDLATMLAPSSLTTLMNRSARDTHQYSGVPRPAPKHAAKAGVAFRQQS